MLEHRCSATYYFFGSQVKEESLFPLDPKAFPLNGAQEFCDSVNHDNTGSPCVFTWPVTTFNSVKRCKHIKGTILGSHGRPLRSDIDSVEKCKYVQGSCVTDTRGFLLWEPWPLYATEYSRESETNGYVVGSYFVSDKFHESYKFKGVFDVGRNLTTDEGYILEVVSKTKSSRAKRDTSTPLLHELEAKFDYLALKESIWEQKILRLCKGLETQQRLNLALMKSDPTAFALRMLRTDLLVAKQQGKLLIVKTCEEVEILRIWPL